MAKSRKQAAAKAAEAVDAVLDAGTSINVTELAQELISALGGIRAFAKTYVDELTKMKAGTIGKAKMMDAVLRIVTSSSTINKDRGKDAGGMSEQELRDAATTLLNKAAP